LAHFILSYFLHFHEFLLNLLGFSGPIITSLPFGLLAFKPISFTNSFLWPLPVHFFFFSISYDSHGLTASFFGAPLGPFTFFGAILLFYRLMDHYFCLSGPMVFTLLFSFSICSYCWAPFTIGPFCQKMGINNGFECIIC